MESAPAAPGRERWHEPAGADRAARRSRHGGASSRRSASTGRSSSSSRICTGPTTSCSTSSTTSSSGRAASRTGRLHIAAGAPRAPAGWGGGKLNALTLVALTPVRGGDCAPDRRPAERPLLRGDPGRAPSPCGRKPALAEQYARMLLEEPGDKRAAAAGVRTGDDRGPSRRSASEEKALLQDAAVLGKVFWPGRISARTTRREAERPPRPRTQRVRPASPSSSVAGEHEYTFLHILVRDVAYAQIPRAERAEKHQRAAEWIESLGRPEDHAEMVAHHYLSALKLARSSGQPTHELVERARLALREAGDRATALNAFDGRGTLVRLGARALARRRSRTSEAAPFLRCGTGDRPRGGARANSKRQRAPSPTSAIGRMAHGRRSCSRMPPGGRARSATWHTRISNAPLTSSMTSLPHRRRQPCSAGRFRAITCSRIERDRRFKSAAKLSRWRRSSTWPMSVRTR